MNTGAILRWSLVVVTTLAVAGGVAWAWSALPGGAEVANNDATRLVPQSTREEKKETARRDADTPHTDAGLVERARSVDTVTVVRSVPEQADPQPKKADAPSADDLRAALAAVQVKMYSASWCPHCTEARNWLNANKIAFSEYDVETNTAAKAEQRRLNPKGGVPTLDVDGEVLVGFSEQSLGKAIARATQRRLRERR